MLESRRWRMRCRGRDTCHGREIRGGGGGGGGGDGLRGSMKAVRQDGQVVVGLHGRARLTRRRSAVFSGQGRGVGKMDKRRRAVRDRETCCRAAFWVTGACSSCALFSHSLFRVVLCALFPVCSLPRLPSGVFRGRLLCRGLGFAGLTLRLLAVLAAAASLFARHFLLLLFYPFLFSCLAPCGYRVMCFRVRAGWMGVCLYVLLPRSRLSSQFFSAEPVQARRGQGGVRLPGWAFGPKMMVWWWWWPGLQERCTETEARSSPCRPAGALCRCRVRDGLSGGPSLGRLWPGL